MVFPPLPVQVAVLMQTPLIFVRGFCVGVEWGGAVSNGGDEKDNLPGAPPEP